MLTISILFIINFSVHAQLRGLTKNSRNEHPQFSYKIHRTVSNVSDTCKLTFLMKVPYDELLFVFEDSVYKAGYELTITILDIEKNVIDTRIKKKYVTLRDFQLTNSRKDFSFLNELFYLAPGEYEIVIELMDIDSKLTRIIRRRINIINYFDIPFSISDVLFLTKSNLGGREIYMPNLVANYDKNHKEIFLKFDIYNNIEINSVDMNLTIRDFRNNLLKNYNYKKDLEGFKTTILLKVEREELGSGNYILDMIIRGGEERIEQGLYFSVNWMNMIVVSRDINTAIQQLRYITTSKKIKEMVNCEDSEIKEELFNQFWASRDPTPSTEVNELREEYYSRVAFANENFSDSREGWLTDRGEVYIVLGAPSSIKRYPHLIESRPYEVWNYYRFGNDLIFVDYTGLDNYSLTPESRDTFNMVRNQY